MFCSFLFYFCNSWFHVHADIGVWVHAKWFLTWSSLRYVMYLLCEIRDNTRKYKREKQDNKFTWFTNKLATSAGRGGEVLLWRGKNRLQKKDLHGSPINWLRPITNLHLNLNSPNRFFRRTMIVPGLPLFIRIAPHGN